MLLPVPLAIVAAADCRQGSVSPALGIESEPPSHKVAGYLYRSMICLLTRMVISTKLITSSGMRYVPL